MNSSSVVGFLKSDYKIYTNGLKEATE